MNVGVVIGLIGVAGGVLALAFGFLAGAMPPITRRAFFEGPAYRDGDPLGYWLNAAFYAGIIAIGGYYAMISW